MKYWRISGDAGFCGTDFEEVICAETREEAAQDKALKLVKTIAPNTCGYSDVDKATQELTNILPEIGIDISQAFAATQYIKSQEDRLNTVDGVVMSSREETQIAKTELSQIQGIMSKIVPPTSESLLDYETELLQYKTEVEIVTDIGPVIGAHSGPGTIAVFFLGKER